MIDDSPINQDEFLRKIEDTHDELLMHDVLNNTKRVSSGDTKFVYNKGVKQPEGKGLIEKEAQADREERTRQLFFELLEHRKIELTDKVDFPITHLVNAVIKLMPQRNENKNENVHTFADAVKKLRMEYDKHDTFDAEGNPI